MEEPSAQNVSPVLAHPTKATAKVFIATLLAVGTVVGSALNATLSHHDLNVNHGHLRSFPSIESIEYRRMEEDAAESCGIECCRQYESTICPNDNAWIEAIPFWLQISLIVLLLCLSALFSGLTLGLMSLDMTGLEIVMGGDDPTEAMYAKKIYPVRRNGNLLLCTLLLGNVAVNALLSIFLAAYTGGVVGFVSSTFLIVIFGEILPQALCSRYALKIGSITVPMVKVIRIILYPIAAPLAWCLDVALGQELATTYSNAEMLKLLQIHVQENVIDKETAGAMTGALTYKNMTVKEAMTPLERTFMLNVDDKLNFETIGKIFKTGYSRIPVYEVSRNNVTGLLFVKDLIFIDPEDGVPIRSFVQIFGRGVHVVWPDDTLGDVLAELKKGKSHIALVRDVNNEDESQDPFYEIKGIITLEDIIEKILGDTIVDETDAFLDSAQQIRVERAGSFEWARLRLLDSKIIDRSLSESEVQAVTAHLRTNYSETVKLLSDTQLRRLVSTTPVSQLEAAQRKIGEDLPEQLLYEKDKPSNQCTLILGGKVTILVGSENFHSEMAAWTILGRAALENPTFCPDFTAYVSDGPCRCLQFSNEAFVEAVDASAIERQISDSKLMSGLQSGETGSVASGSVVDALSVGSGEVPNRRKKLLDKIFKKEITGEARDNRDKAPEVQRTLSVHFSGAIEASERYAINESTNGWKEDGTHSA